MLVSLTGFNLPCEKRSPRNSKKKKKRSAGWLWGTRMLLIYFSGVANRSSSVKLLLSQLWEKKAWNSRVYLIVIENWFVRYKCVWTVAFQLGQLLHVGVCHRWQKVETTATSPPWRSSTFGRLRQMVTLTNSCYGRGSWQHKDCGLHFRILPQLWHTSSEVWSVWLWSLEKGANVFVIDWWREE